MVAARLSFYAAALALLMAPVVGLAGQTDVLAVDVQPAASADRFDFTVTLRHADEGWGHYANRWEILGPDGTVLATRVLAHPHVNEQPFSRSLRDVRLPSTLTWVRVRGHDLVHGYGGREVTVSVPGR